MRLRARVPSLRDGLVVNSSLGSSPVIEDKLNGTIVGIDRMTLKVVRVIARGSVTPQVMTRELTSPRLEILRSVSWLDSKLLLNTPRARHQLALRRKVKADKPLKDVDLGEVPLRYPPSFSEGKASFTAHQEILSDRQALASTPTGSLDYVFTRTPQGVDVSFSCAAPLWWKSRRQHWVTPPCDSDMRALLSAGYPLRDLPQPIEVYNSFCWSFDEWRSLQERQLVGCAQAQNVCELVSAICDPFLSMLTSTQERYTRTENFLRRECWGIPEPVSSTHNATMNFMTGCRVFREALISMEAESCTQSEGDEILSEHDKKTLIRVIEALTHLCATIRLEHVAPAQCEVEIWRNVVASELRGHEPALSGDLITGMTLLCLKVVAGTFLSRMLAQSDNRSQSTEKDIVDSVIMLTKMLRSVHLGALFKVHRWRLFELFVVNASVFTRGQAPRVLSEPWLVRA